MTAFLTFAVVTTFTPGPNNISSSSMGILFGYRKTLPYLIGIVSGFFLIMLLSSIVSSTLYAVLPSIETYMRLIGAGYIVWLAYKTLRSSYQLDGNEAPVLGTRDGFMLQLVNPKGWVYGLTMYTTFLAGITGEVPLLFLSVVFLTCVAFCAISTWTITGATIRRYLRNPKIQQAINIILALLLVYTAISIAGLI